MQKTLIKFGADENGAVSVDFVVLTASVIFMCLAMMNELANDEYNIGDAIADQVAAAE
ncbi:MAG: hypothetical protein WCC57_14105 [Paracoccaceae bacterium]